MAYDWILIKNEFVSGILGSDGEIHCPTLQELNDRYGVSISQLKKKSANEHWVQERNLYRTKIEQKVQEKKVLHVASEAASFSSLALDTATKDITVIKYKLDNNDLTSMDVQKLSDSLLKNLQSGNLALGEPTEHVQSDNKQDVIINDKADTRSDIADLYERWDEKTDKSSGSGKG